MVQTQKDEINVEKIYKLTRDEKTLKIYFVYEGGASDEIQKQLGHLRLNGVSALPLSLAEMEAAIAQGTCEATLSHLERTYFDCNNLFYAKNAIRDESNFFGRIALLTQVGAHLERGESLALTGVRKVGKTSFLHQLQRAIDTPWCAVDLQQYDPDAQDWHLDVSRQLVQAVDQWGARRLGVRWTPLTPPSRGDGDALREALAPGIAQLRRGGHNKPIVLALDEVERVIPRDGEDARRKRFVTFTGALRALAQAPDRPLALITADLRPTINRVNLLPGSQDTNPVFSFFQEIALPMWTLEEVALMARAIGAMMGLAEVTDAFIQRLHQRSGGHPAMARMIAGASFEARAHNERLDLHDLQSGLERLEDSWELGNFLEENLWKPMTRDEQEAARLLLQNKDTSAHKKTLASLRAQGLVQKNHFTIQAFEEWLTDELRADPAA